MKITYHINGFTLKTKHGENFFKNSQKFYKFQLLCEHPSCYVHHSKNLEEKVCERCCMIVSSTQNGVVTDHVNGDYGGSRLPTTQNFVCDVVEL